MGSVYEIRNTLTGGAYIGSTKDGQLRRRWRTHRQQLEAGIHHSRYLQRAWNKYGDGVFQFAVLATVDDSVLRLTEQQYLDSRKSLPRRMTYNVCWDVNTQLGNKRSVASRRKSSASHQGLTLSAESRRKVADTWVSRYGREYSLRSPGGTVYQNIRNLRRFAREHDLSPQGLRAVASGLQAVHHGWSLPDYIPVQYRIMSPSGECIEGIPELKSFCRAHGLNYKALHRAMQTRKPFNGWSVSTVADQRRRKGIVR